MSSAGIPATVHLLNKYKLLVNLEFPGLSLSFFFTVQVELKLEVSKVLHFPPQSGLVKKTALDSQWQGKKKKHQVLVL